MKKNIYLFIASTFFFCLTALAQNSIPNGNFEQWKSGTYDEPQFFIGSNAQCFTRMNAAFNCVKSTDAYHGSYALQLTTNVGTKNDTNMAYLVNANAGDGDPCSWPGGIPYNQQATGITGYYKSNIVAGDSSGILVVFKKAGVCLGMYMYKFGGTHSTYTQFSYTFSPALATAPDTMIFAAISSDVFNNIQKAGSTITLDYLSFTGVASQPAQFNGDFEQWQSHTLYQPDNWSLNTDDQGSGIYQTTDKKAGNYAIELKTFLGNKNGKSYANPAGISNGYHDDKCHCEKGGWPFTHQIDTLAFYYKYTPSGNDSADVNMNFKYKGNNVWGSGKYLGASATYKYVEIPFNTGSSIDTVIINIQSSLWKDSLVSFVGSDLKIDEIHFKSQPLTTGIKPFTQNTQLSVYPNPSTDGSFTVTNVGAFDLVRVYSIFGQEVNAAITKDAGCAHIQIPSSGAYFVQINSNGKITTKKIIVNLN